MVILKAIGGFFAKIGRWIRDTAWVQPLLIVGGIFAVIFSIPYIVDGIKAATAGGNESEAYYETKKVSLNGAEKEESEADQLLDYIVARSEGTQTPEQVSKWGEKFFLTFVQKGCYGCETIQPGFETLQNEWNKSEFTLNGEYAGEEFKLYTIFTDEETDDENLTGSETSFKKYFWQNHADFFEQAATAVEDRPYYNEEGGSTSEYASLLQKIDDPENFQTPTTFMIDFKNAESGTWTFGISDILFNFEPYKNNESSFGYARTLFYCWTHSEMFAGE